MAAQLDALKGLGLEVYYLASWHDPFGDPGLYAREMFEHWGLGPQGVLLVLVRGEGGWRAAGVLGVGLEGKLPREAFQALLVQVQAKLGQLHPGRVALWWVDQLLLLAQGKLSQEDRGLPSWAYAILAAVGTGALAMVLAHRLCPRCLRPLRRVRSWGGIIYRCPRCWYTRAPRRGRGPGSRGGFYP